jgi:hypothetical protein
MVRTVHPASGRARRSAPGPDGVEALGLQDLHDGVPVVALQFDDAVLRGAPDAAALLEATGQGAQAVVVHRDVRDGRDGLPATPGRLTADLDAPPGAGGGDGVRVAGLAQISVARGVHDTGPVTLGHVGEATVARPALPVFDDDASSLPG